MRKTRLLISVDDVSVRRLQGMLRVNGVIDADTCSRLREQLDGNCCQPFPTLLPSTAILLTRYPLEHGAFTSQWSLVHEIKTWLISIAGNLAAARAVLPDGSEAEGQRRWDVFQPLDLPVSPPHDAHTRTHTDTQTTVPPGPHRA